MVTSFMSLTLPTPSVTLGPEWATELNAALELVDSHDHTSGKGKKITPAAINVNSNLSLGGYSATEVLSAVFNDQSASPSTPSSVYSLNGDLYWNNGSAVPVQLTSGGSIVSTPASVENLDYQAVNTDTTISSASTVVFLDVDTTATRTITLPAASAVPTGRIYVIKDASGQSETNTLTIVPNGSDTIDGAASLAINSNYASIVLISNGTNSYKVW